MESPTAPAATVTRGQTVVTVVLLSIWVFLMAFGLVSGLFPSVLGSFSRTGRMVEAIDYKNYGDIALRQKQYPVAIAQYRRSLAIQPDEPKVMTNLGIAYIQAGAVREGVEMLAEALAKTDSPVTRGTIHHNLGDLLEKQGVTDKAIQAFEEAVKTGVELEVRYLRLGRLYLGQKQIDRAYECFQKAMEAQLDPTRSYREMLLRDLDTMAEEPEHRARIEAKLQEGVTAEDLAPYDLATIRWSQERDQGTAVLHNYLGWCLVQSNHFGEAARHFEASLQIWPENRNALENLKVIEQIRAEQPGLVADPS